MKNNTWLLIANASKARVFSFCKPRFIQAPHCKELTLEDQCEHEESRKKGSDLIADKAGGFGNGSFVEGTPPKRHEAEIFAKDLMKILEIARKADNEREFIIAAPPAFLGLLKKHLTSPMNKKISLMIEKDYTSHEHNDLATALMDHF